MTNIILMKSSLTYFLLLVSFFGYSQDLTGPELLDKSIKFHDPNGNWNSFNGSFQVTMETPNNPARLTDIKIDIPKEYFYSKAQRDTVVTTYELNKEKCLISKTDSMRIALLKEKPARSHCEMTELYKNYYTYLYGLPMKLKDPGTIIDPKVRSKSFKGKDYLVLKASYDEKVGSDVWFFYFDPKTYAMEIYQFYKGDPEGKGKDTGEYILLSEMETVNEIKMPKTRAWYYNKDDKYLGTDILKQ